MNLYFLSLCFPIYFPASSSAATDGRIFAFQQLGGRRRRRWRYSPYCRPGHNFPLQPRKDRRRQPLRSSVLNWPGIRPALLCPRQRAQFPNAPTGPSPDHWFWHCPKTFSYSLTVSGPMSRIISSAGTLSTGCTLTFWPGASSWPLQHQQAGAVPCQPFASSIIFLASRHKIRFIKGGAHATARRSQNVLAMPPPTIRLSTFFSKVSSRPSFCGNFRSRR